MKHIAIIITRMIPGGASKVIEQILEGAKTKKNYKFTLFTGTESIDEKLILQLSQHCTIVRISQLIRNISPLKDYAAYKCLVCELRNGNFDVVHTHTSKAGFIGRIAAAKVKVPIIIHSPHGSIYTTDSNIEGVPKFSLGKKVLQMAERFAGKKTTYLTTLSEHEKKLCIELGLSTEKNSIVIANGINCAKFALTDNERAIAKNELGLKPEDIMLLSVGRLSSEKGQNILIDAFAKLNKRQDGIKNLKLFLVGEGPEKEALQHQMASLKLSCQIFFPGHCCDIRKYLAAGDIFIAPSLYEGFGIAIIEAMAAKLPVIASKTGGIPEIISNNENGILFTTGNSTELSNKLLDLLNKPEKMKKIAIAAKKRVNCFSEKSMIENYLKLYNTSIVQT